MHVSAKVINNRLVIRVGGGYMGADEFIAHHGQIELQKLMNLNKSQSLSFIDFGDTTRSSVGFRKTVKLPNNSTFLSSSFLDMSGSPLKQANTTCHRETVKE